MMKPNQIVDEITGAIYPPAEAVTNQLTTIRAIIPSTIKMYESTGDIHTIQPNLDMIQRAINYLRGAPPLIVNPEVEVNEPEINASSDLSTTVKVNSRGEYDISVLGIDVEPVIQYNVRAVETTLTIKDEMFNSYLVTEQNPFLSNVPNELLVDMNNGEWVKETTYTVDEDSMITYSFFLLEGRTKVRIAFESVNRSPIIFNISAHIHFKETEKE